MSGKDVDRLLAEDWNDPEVPEPRWMVIQPPKQVYLKNMGNQAYFYDDKG